MISLDESQLFSLPRKHLPKRSTPEAKSEYAGIYVVDGNFSSHTAVFILKSLLPTDLENVSLEQQARALKGIIYFYSFMSAATAFLIWFS